MRRYRAVPSRRAETGAYTSGIMPRRLIGFLLLLLGYSLVGLSLSESQQTTFWGTIESREEAYCIAQQPHFPDRNNADPQWRLQDLQVNHASFIAYDTLVKCFLRYRAPNDIALDGGVLEGDAQRFGMHGEARMRAAIRARGNDIAYCYTDEVMAALHAIELEQLLFGEARQTQTLGGRLQQILNQETASLDKFAAAFASQTTVEGNERIGFAADLRRAQVQRKNAFLSLNKGDFPHALIAGEDSALLLQAVEDELNCPIQRVR